MSNAVSRQDSARRWAARATAVTALAAPLLAVGMGSASAAELTPVAQYLDATVSSTEHEVGAAVDALGLKAE